MLETWTRWKTGYSPSNFRT